MSRAWSLTKIVTGRMRFILLFVVIGLVVGKWDWIMAVVEKAVGHPKAADTVAGEYEWFCPMHPTIVRPDNMRLLASWIRGCDDIVEIPEAGHFVPEWGEKVISAAREILP